MQATVGIRRICEQAGQVTLTAELFSPYVRWRDSRRWVPAAIFWGDPQQVVTPDASANPRSFNIFVTIFLAILGDSVPHYVVAERWPNGDEGKARLIPLLNVRPIACMVSLTLVAAAGLAAADPECPVFQTPPTQSELRDLITSTAAEGLPLKLFRRFQTVPGAAETAMSYLNPSMVRTPATWSNAIYALGAIGDAASYDRIVKFLKEPVDPLTKESKLSYAVFEAKVDALFAVGDVAGYSRIGSVRQRALDLLDGAASADSNFWKQLTWESPMQASPAARNAYLAGKVRLIKQALTTIKPGSDNCDTSVGGTAKIEAAAHPFR